MATPISFFNKNEVNCNMQTSSDQQNKKIYSKVLKKITPTQKDLNAEKKIFLEIKEKIDNMQGHHSHLEWCGSSARNTHLKSDRDLDLFVMFEKEMDSKQLEKEGLKIGKSVFRGHTWEKAYSQHPYIRGKIKNFDIEIVPSYIVSRGSEKKSAVDRTPFHNKFILKNLSENQRKEVRLLKQFLKGIGAYGADLKNCSLPGYGVELLIVKYKTFENVLKNTKTWKCGTQIKFNNKKSKVKFDQPLIIIDPVDENRNVASALSEEQFKKIKLASAIFLQNPNIKFFFPKKIKVWKKEKVKKALNQKELIAIHSKFPKNDLSDIVWGQLRRFLKKITRHLVEKDFNVLRETLWSDEKDIYFIIQLGSLDLQKSKKLIGPKAVDTINVENFLKDKKNILSGPRIENERIVIEVPRKETNAIKLIEKFIKENKKSERKAVKKMLKYTRVINEKEMLKHYKKNFAQFFTKYLDGKESFE